MIKSQLVLRIAEMNPHLYQRDVETVVNAILEEVTDALRRGDRVELRGFGAFSVKRRDARAGRNPRTGERVDVGEKAVAQFRAGKEMRQRLNLDGDAGDGDKTPPPRRGKAARAPGPDEPSGGAQDTSARRRGNGAVASDARGEAASTPAPLGDASKG